jgi:sec-independent protein translocase protein TatC
MAVIPKIPRLRRGRKREVTMTLVEHLGELRTRLLVSLFAIGLGVVVGWFLYPHVFSFLKHPYCSIIAHTPQLNPFPGKRCVLVFTSVAQPFLVKIKVASFLGIGIALPVVLYEVWAFITPGLTTKERRFALPFVLASLVLFALGAWFAFVTLPKALNFLLGFAGTKDVVAVLDIAKYISFVLLLVVVFGLSFEFPLLLVSLVVVGVLTSARLRHYRRHAILGIAIFAAVITPSQDWFTMTAMMVPLVVFYELSILVSRFLLKK